MAGAARCFSSIASVRDLPPDRLRRADSPLGHPGHPLLLQRNQMTSALAWITLPPMTVDRSSGNTFIGEFARLDGFRTNCLLKLSDILAWKRKTVGLLNSKHFVRTQIQLNTGCFMMDASSQPEESVDDQGSKINQPRNCTTLRPKHRSSLSGVSLESLESLQKIALSNFKFQSFLAATAWSFFVPSEALAETCENSSNYFNMPLLLLIALVGATVGGLLARQRKAELARLNDQLRQINAALRRQAKIESYAPNLSYAPVGRVAETDIIVDPKKQELISLLKTGKNYLRHQNPAKAFNEFKSALELAQSLGDPVEEKKAARGLGASLQRQGKFREAIKYHSLVLSISKRTGEESGNTEAFGAIADCYTELGDLDHAGRFYDQYIARLEKD